MKAKGLDHFSIGTSKLEETRAFFCDVLGLEVGPRPSEFTSKGYWLYAGDKPLIHLLEQAGKPAADGPATSEELVDSGLDDHIAITVSESTGLVAEIESCGLAYWDRLLADRGLYQVFVRDPNGVVIELNDYSPAVDKLKPAVVQGAGPGN